MPGTGPRRTEHLTTHLLCPARFLGSFPTHVVHLLAKMRTSAHQVQGILECGIAASNFCTPEGILGVVAGSLIQCLPLCCLGSFSPQPVFQQSCPLCLYRSCFDHFPRPLSFPRNPTSSLSPRSGIHFLISCLGLLNSLKCKSEQVASFPTPSPVSVPTFAVFVSSPDLSPHPHPTGPLHRWLLCLEVPGSFLSVSALPAPSERPSLTGFVFSVHWFISLHWNVSSPKMGALL